MQQKPVVDAAIHSTKSRQQDRRSDNFYNRISIPVRLVEIRREFDRARPKDSAICKLNARGLRQPFNSSLTVNTARSRHEDA